MEFANQALVDSIVPQWRTHLAGAGRIVADGTSLRFHTGGAVSGSYTNAQIDDYQNLPRNRFAWAPPVRLCVSARFSHGAEQLRGTAGFGFWNDPFFMTQRRLPALPRAAWFFFASMPSNIKLDTETPGHGWKAACIDAQRLSALSWAPLAPLLVPLMNLAPLYSAVWPHIQRALRIREAAIPVDLTRWHTYELCWEDEFVNFTVSKGHTDEKTSLLRAAAPKGPLGFVLWQDNQYLELTPWGRIRWGTLDVREHQWMEVKNLRIHSQRDARTSGGTEL